MPGSLRAHLGIQAWSQQGAVCRERSLPLRQHTGGQAPGELHLMFNGSVLAEMPCKPILVVGNLRSIPHQPLCELTAQQKATDSGWKETHRGDKGQDEAAAAAHFTVASAILDVFPQHAMILLMHADCLLDQHRLPLIRVEHGIEVVNLQEASEPQKRSELGIH